MKALFPSPLLILWYAMILIEVWLAVESWIRPLRQWPTFRLYLNCLAVRSVALLVASHSDFQNGYIRIYWIGLGMLDVVIWSVAVETYRNVFFPTWTVPLRVRQALRSALVIIVLGAITGSVAFPGTFTNHLTLVTRDIDRANTFATLFAFLVIYACSKWLLIPHRSLAMGIVGGFLFFSAVTLATTHASIEASSAVVNALSYVRTLAFILTLGVWLRAVRSRTPVFTTPSRSDLEAARNQLSNLEASLPSHRIESPQFSSTVPSGERH